MSPAPAGRARGAGAPEPPRDDLRGGAWLIADMSLNIWALSIVKWLGAGYPATQVVFLRAAVGLVLIAPLIWRGRARFRGVADLRLHLLRVALSVVTLSASFYAIARVPLAVFTAVGFTRPLVTMLLALVRAFRGPTVFDRVLAANMFGTKTVLLIAVSGFLAGRPEWLDLAILYALMNFIGMIALLRFSKFDNLAEDLLAERAQRAQGEGGES